MKRFFTTILTAVTLLCGVTASAFEIRGLHIDMRTEVMTMDGLKDLASRAAASGINTIIMEWEATFPFVENSTLCNDEAYTRAEVKDFVDYCAKIGIDVIPLQNCFGHCEYILRHDRYGALREDSRDCAQVCPSQEKLAREVFASIFKEIAEMHPSQYIHIGADETRLLGKCKKCAAKVEAEGKSKLFCDYIIAMCDVVRSLGKTPVIWADILTKYPEAAQDLPKDLILLDWNYGWNKNKFGDFENIVNQGFPMWGATALRSAPDDVHNVQWMKHFNNLKEYLWYANELGFKGIINTSWSDSGVYGYTYNGQNYTVELHPQRMVYPLSGFKILENAFFEASAAEEQFDPESYIRRYCADEFGLDEDGIATMFEYFNLPQSLFTFKNCKDIPAELEATLDFQKKFKGLKAKSNKNEFAHFKLMLDIRANYLKYQDIKYKYESKDFNGSMKASMASDLKKVMKEGKSLQKRFIKLNKWYLKNPVRWYGPGSYLDEMKFLYANLTNKL